VKQGRAYHRRCRPQNFQSFAQKTGSFLHILELLVKCMDSNSDT